MIDEDTVKKAFDLLKGFSPRIEELEKQYETEIKVLRKENKKLWDENDNLRIQIIKMKCCENCINYNLGDCKSEHFYDCKHWNNQNLEDYWSLNNEI